MGSKIFKFMVGAVLALVVCLLLVFNGLLLWVAQEPRSLSALSPYIEEGLSATDGSYNVKIGETLLIWDGWRHPIDIKLRDVAVLTKENQLFSRFPEISLGIDVISLPLGRVLPTSLAIKNPTMSLIQNDDHSISLGFKPEGDTAAAPEAQNIPFAALAAPLVSTQTGNFRKLHTLIIDDARLSVSNANGEFFKASDADISLHRDDTGRVVINSNATMQYGDQETKIISEFSLEKGKTDIQGSVNFGTLKPDLLAQLFMNNEYVKMFAFPINGEVSLDIDVNGGLQRLGLDLRGDSGSFYSNAFDDELALNSSSLKATFSNNFQDIKIDELKADIDGVQFSANGTANIAEDNDPEVHATLSLANVKGESLSSFWPSKLAPITREWVLANITKGSIPLATAKIDIKHGDLKLPLLPKEDVDANIQLDGVQVRYLPEHPPLTNLKGNVHVDGIALDAAIASADFLKETKLSNGRVLIEDLNPDNPYLKVELAADGPARDIVHFMGLPRLKHAERLGLNEELISGNVTGTASLGFHFFLLNDADLTYDIKTNVSGITQQGFMKKFDLTDAAGAITINNKSVMFTGTGNVNGANASDAKVSYLFTPEKGFDTFIDVTANAQADSLKRFGYPDFPFLKGSFGVKASIKEGANTEVSQASFDLTDTAVSLDDMGWNKPVKEPASFDISAEKKESGFIINSFALKGKNADAKGSAMLSKDLASVASLSMEKYAVGASDLNVLNYKKDEEGVVLEAKGKALDLNHYMNSGSSDFSFAHFPATNLKADIDALILGDNRAFHNVKATLICDENICQNADIAGNTSEGKNFDIKILRNPKAKRQLSIHADDGGAFLQIAGILQGMEGGDLTLIGNYDEAESGSTLKGRLNISEHTIKDAPVLAKILSLASFSGLIDTLRGNGISFSKMSIPFTLHDDVVTIENGKTFGSAIGLTVEGTITFPQKALDLNGTVVPSYSLNTAIDKVPVVGDMLTGGKGQGIFAARYTVKGTEKDSNVSVNPLSILTPGFLRGLFDVLDSKKKSD